MAEPVNDAYGHYLERLGMLPRPMTYDYAEVMANRRVTVAESHRTIVGLIVLAVDDEGASYEARVASSVSLRTIT